LAHLLFLDKKIRQYQSAKRSLIELHQDLFANVGKDKILSCAKKLSLFKRGEIVFPAEECADAFADFLIYSWPTKDTCEVATVKFEDDQDLFHGMQNNLFSIFIVKSLGDSKVRVEDIFRSGLVQDVYDLNLSKSVKGELLFATRLLKFSNFSCFSGAGFPVVSNEMLNDVQSSTDRLLKRYNAISVQDLSPLQETEFEAMVIKLCLKHKAYEFFLTEDI
jgi:hypothetical protein